MAATIRTMTLNVGTLSVPVALRTASEKKLPTFSTASPWGHKFERHVPGSGDLTDKLVETLEDAKAVAGETGQATETVLARATEPEYVDLVTGEVFTEDQIQRGVWEGDVFYGIDGHAITQIDQSLAQPDLTIQQFVPLDSIPWERVKGGYYLTPNKGAGLKALNLLRCALEQTGTAGIALLMPKSRVHLAVIYAAHGGVIVSTLAYAEEWKQVRDGAAVLEDPRGEPSEKELTLAVALVNALSADDASALDEVGDLQAQAKVELIEKAKLGEPLTSDAPPEVTVGFNERGETLLEQKLRESLEAAALAKGKTPNGSKRTRKTTSAKKPKAKSADKAPGTSGRKARRPVRA
jgi:DNA end-binding protein Ku